MNAPVHQASKDYLEAIFEMEEEGAVIQQARIAKRLGVSASTVSEHVSRLKRGGLLEVEGRNIHLSKAGAEAAWPLVRRHRLAERLLTDLLDIPWHRAHEEAHMWEHAISPEVEDRILTKTGARTCPHGNPIPGLDPPYERKTLVPLTNLKEGETGVLALLTEDVELVTDVLKYFEEHGLMPGARIDITAVGPDGTLMLEVDGKPASLGSNLADNLWVQPAET